jgi:hypothetical protein
MTSVTFAQADSAVTKELLCNKSGHLVLFAGRAYSKMKQTFLSKLSYDKS